MLWGAIKDVFLFSPDDETTERIKRTAGEVLAPYRFSPAFFDIIRTGRLLWIAVYFTVPGDSLLVADLKRASEQISRTMEEQFENCVCELILVPDEAAPQPSGSSQNSIFNEHEAD